MWIVGTTVRIYIYMLALILPRGNIFVFKTELMVSDGWSKALR